MESLFWSQLIYFISDMTKCIHPKRSEKYFQQRSFPFQMTSLLDSAMAQKLAKRENFLFSNNQTIQINFYVCTYDLNVCFNPQIQSL